MLAKKNNNEEPYLIEDQIELKDISNLKVLLVDDNEINLKLARTLLNERGVKTDTSNNGDEAIKLSESNCYDLIFMDLHMPQTDGFQATRIIRQSSNINHDTAIIALTANAMPEEQLEAYDAGMNDILIKPITEQQLFDILERWTDAPLDSQNLDQQTKQNNKTPVSNEIYDNSESIKLAGGNEKLANELFEMLINELPTHKEKLIAALENNKPEDMKYSAHKLHGATSYCGVPSLRVAAQELEIIIDNNDHELFEEAFQAVIREIDRLLDYART